MVIIIYSAETEKSIMTNMGAPEYSYYFVLKKFYVVLHKIAHIVEVKNPEIEVDIIYENCRLRGEACLFLSFSPPHKTVTGLTCPTISVFAWEYMTIPTDKWSEDQRSDWRYVFRKHGCAITHSTFAVRAVQKAMGNDFPVWSIPAPVWDDYTKLYRKGKASAQSEGFNLSFEGIFIDFQRCEAPSVSEESKKDFIEQRSYPQKDKKVNLHLEGIIYTSVFNPGDGRKNWEDLVKGFIWAFRKLEDVTLVLKVIYHDFEEASRTITDELFKLMPFRCRVVILHGYLSDDEYAKLIQATTYVVNTAYGEGQCLPLMEYMSAGKPAIAPAHTAMEDYINKDNSFVVQSSAERTYWPHDPRYTMRTMRYQINWESLYHAYLESYQVAKNDPVRYLRMSGCAAESLKKYCSEAVVKKRLKIVFRKHGMKNKDVLIFNLKRVWRKVLSLIRLLSTSSGRLFSTIRSFFRAAVKAGLLCLLTFFKGIVMFGLKNLLRKWNASLRKMSAVERHQGNDSAVSSGPEKIDPTLVDALLTGWFKNETGELIEGFKISSEDVVLYAGCGDRPFVYFCAKQGAEIIFADIDAPKVAIMTKILEGSPARSVTALVSDACSLPVKDASVSKIIAMEIMEHVDDPGKLLKELVRVGKPGAQYLITVPDPVAETLQKKLAPSCYFAKPHHVRVIGREEFEQQVVDAGLVVEQCKYYGFYWSIWWMFFWACNQDLCPPWHPLLESWTQTWKLLLETQDGPKVKRVLDDFMPKSQAIIARKPK